MFRPRRTTSGAMAKLHDDSDDELPDLSAVMAIYAKADPPGPSSKRNVTSARDGARGPSTLQRKPLTSVDSHPTRTETFDSPGDETRRMRRQRSLRIAPVHTVLLSRWTGASGAAQPLVESALTGGESFSENRKIQLQSKFRKSHGREGHGRRSPRCSSDGIPVDIVSRAGAEAVDEHQTRPTRPPRRRDLVRAEEPNVATAKPTSTGSLATSLDFTGSAVRVGSPGPDCMQAGDSSGHGDLNGLPTAASFLPGGEFSSEPSAMLRFSPPRSRRKSPVKCADQGSFTTPPATPSKSKLQSPKKQHRIPPSPHRPSIDAFWSQDVINDWNDEYSPRKVPGRARRIYPIIDENDNEFSPSTSPRKSPVKSPGKRDRKALEVKKAFNEKKHELARQFLKELDDVVVSGQIASLAASTGGVRLIWSKKLNSTAGRANWRQEVVRSTGNATPPVSKYRHHASIELAEKVIDDEHRLINVIAHEYCHLANFMISGIKNNPHGKEFKQWARKCSEAFAHRGIEVTTKHSYIIDYKYIWECTTCAVEFKRHSKSIDPARHTCGACKSKLAQTKPVPRTAAPSDYQLYFKAHFQRTKNAHPESSHKEVMGLLAKEYKEHKAKTWSTVAVPAVTELVDVQEEEEIADEEVWGDDETDTVARTLDFLSLTN